MMNMDCDRVFDILTRGPFPTGEASDQQVEAHLAECFDCYRLAEALRPALELFEESIPSDEGRDLPGYWGELQTAPLEMVRSSRMQVAPEPPASVLHPAPQPQPRLWHLIAQPIARIGVAVLIGVVLAMGLRVAGLSEKPLPWDTASVVKKKESGPAMMSVPSGEPLLAEMIPSSRQLLRALQFAPACLGLTLEPSAAPGTITLAQLDELGSQTELRCCTNCHSERTTGRAPQAVSAILHSCAACHQ